MDIDGKQFLLPIGVANPIGGDRYRVDQFAGSSFFVNGSGWLATCKHNVPELSDGRHYVARYLEDGSTQEITGIRPEPTKPRRRGFHLRPAALPRLPITPSDDQPSREPRPPTPSLTRAPTNPHNPTRRTHPAP